MKTHAITSGPENERGRIAVATRVALIALITLSTVGCLNPLTPPEENGDTAIPAGHGEISVSVALRRASSFERLFAATPGAADVGAPAQGSAVSGSALSGNATDVTYTVRDQSQAVVATETVAAWANMFEFTIALPEGTGYTMELEFSAETYDATRVVLRGTSNPFDISPGQRQSMWISPLPVDPVVLSDGEPSVPFDLSPATYSYDIATDTQQFLPGGEVWFAFQPTKPYVDVRIMPSDPDKTLIETYVYTVQDGSQDVYGPVAEIVDYTSDTFVRRFGPFSVDSNDTYPTVVVSAYPMNASFSGYEVGLGGPFAVEMTAHDGPSDDAIEPNEDASSAVDLPAGSTIDRGYLLVDESDWYILTTGAAPGTWHLVTMTRSPWETPSYAWYINGTEVFARESNVGAAWAYQHRADQTAQLRMYYDDTYYDATEYTLSHDVLTPSTAEIGVPTAFATTDTGVTAIEVALPEAGTYRITVDDDRLGVADWLQPMVFAPDGSLVAQYSTNTILSVDTSVHGVGSYLIVVDSIPFLDGSGGSTALVNKTLGGADLAALQILASDGQTVLSASTPTQDLGVVAPGAGATVDFVVKNPSDVGLNVSPTMIDTWSVVNGTVGPWVVFSGFRGGVIEAGESRTLSFTVAPSAPSGSLESAATLAFDGDAMITFGITADIAYADDGTEPNDTEGTAARLAADTDYQMTKSLPTDQDYFVVSVPAGATYLIDGAWQSDGYPMEFTVEPQSGIETGYDVSEAQYITNSGAAATDVVFRPAETPEFGPYRLSVRSTEIARSILYVEHPLGGTWGSDEIVGVPETGTLPLTVYNDGNRDLEVTTGFVTDPYRLDASFPLTIPAGEQATLGIAAGDHASEWSETEVSIRLFSDADIDGTFADTFLARKGYPNPDSYEPDDDRASATAISFGDTVSASIHEEPTWSSSPDWFQVDLAADTTYRLSLSATGTSWTYAKVFGEADDVYRERLIYDGTADPATLDFTATESGSHYIEISGSRVWRYDFSISEVTP